jgi:hypothetical protein
MLRVPGPDDSGRRLLGLQVHHGHEIAPPLLPGILHAEPAEMAEVDPGGGLGGFQGGGDERIHEGSTSDWGG